MGGMLVWIGAATAEAQAPSTSPPAAAADSTLNATPLTIVHAGRSDYCIVCARDSAPATLLAATELQAFIERATGARLRILAAAEPGRPALELRPDESLPRDSFRLQVAGANLIISGHDTAGNPERIDYERPVSCGTLYGVYEFLERYLGVRFYWPDELGTIVPRRDTLTVPGELDVRQEPRFALRQLWHGPGMVSNWDEAASRIWGRRLRLGASFAMKFNHAWWPVLDVEDWARRGHPEYAALRKGERQARYEGKHHHGQVCVSNPEVQAVFVEAARRSPEPMFSVSPNDGYGDQCECERCRTLDNGRLIPDGRHAGLRDLSDRIMGFYNLVAERSGRPVGGYAYNEYIEVPAGVQLHPNVWVSLAPNNAWASGNAAEWARSERLYRAWGRYCPRTTVYDILYHAGQMPGMIAPLWEDVDRRMHLLAASGLAGGLFYIAPEMELGGPDAYVAAKLLWDPTADAQRLREDYFRDLYGAGWRAVETLYREAAGQWRVVVGASTPEAFRAKEKKVAAHLVILPRLEEHLARAEREAGSDEQVRRRLARLRAVLERMASERGS